VGSIFVDGWHGRWESAKVNESKGKSYPTLCDPLKLDEYFFKRLPSFSSILHTTESQRSYLMYRCFADPLTKV